MPVQPERAPLDSGPFAHTAVAYGSDEEFLHRIPDLVVGGLRDGQRVLVVTCERKLDLLTETLGEDARRVDRQPSHRWYGHPMRTLSAYHDYVRERRPSLIVGEVYWAGRTDAEAREWIRYESAINAVLARLPVAVWCLYERGAAPDDLLRVHPRYLDAGDVEPSGLYVPPERFRLPDDELPFGDPPGSATVVSFAPENLTHLRLVVADHARRAGLDHELTGSLVLSVSEVAANSVEHGAGHGRAALWVEGDELVCEITDSGGGLDDPLAGYGPPEPESQHGYGLWISRQLCDRVEIRSSPGLVRIRLRMSLR
ncbi:anti-sigma factor RsbA family regulatory protein [Planobispora siamensis]|uniref:sensor histidine kinase n=1 Tax=Planobispora siamensis TaxID=936338 RepID=UPI0019502881|nr:sensor histidine kinase [Planobispora siamensis]